MNDWKKQMSTKKSIADNLSQIKQLFLLVVMWEHFYLHVIFYPHMVPVPASPLHMQNDHSQRQPHERHT